ncbi:MAG: phosphotransferase [Bordetella sp.]|uniref:phosphotransferase n=1 Tax=Bordetella sp. TaxID=28081 RepID=UPI003F7B4403
MIDACVDARAAFLEKLGIHGPMRIEAIGHGRNSRVERIANDEGEWILKHYHAAGPQSHDRLGAEYGFLEYLNAQGIARVARPVGLDRSAHLALYTKLDGRRMTRATDDHIRQAAAFIGAINANASSEQARALPSAADACATWDDHLRLARARMAQFKSLSPKSDIERSAHRWIAERLAPTWRAIDTSLHAHASASADATPILSPSDFGFHNTLDDGGALSFVDFEYAGWDDPAKLACDFLCQPEIPVDPAQGALFVDLVAQHLGLDKAWTERVALLLPIHRLKWCCILLNEFRAEHRARREHAGVATQDILEAQYAKARRYYADHLENIHEQLSTQHGLH